MLIVEICCESANGHDLNKSVLSYGKTIFYYLIFFMAQPCGARFKIIEETAMISAFPNDKAVLSLITSSLPFLLSPLTLVADGLGRRFKARCPSHIECFISLSTLWLKWFSCCPHAHTYFQADALSSFIGFVTQNLHQPDQCNDSASISSFHWKQSCIQPERWFKRFHVMSLGVAGTANESLSISHLIMLVCWSLGLRGNGGAPVRLGNKVIYLAKWEPAYF